MAMSQSILGRRIDGIWHTGIVVFNKEYYFGGGIQVTPLGAFAMSHQLPAVQTLDMGTTTKTEAELTAYLRSIGSQYTQFTYNLITNNCNHFANNICTFLTGHGIPEHIVDLPKIVFSTPGGAMLRPMIEGMQANIMQQHIAGSLDPFSSGPPDGRTLEAALSDAVQSVGMQMARNASQPAQVASPRSGTSRKLSDQPPSLAPLEEQALVSGDASTVGVIGKKILNLPGSDGTPGTALTEEEKTMLTGVLDELSRCQVGSKAEAVVRPHSFPVEAYVLLERVLAQHPAAHMACLFVVRLMLLHDRANEFDKLSIVKEILRRLMTHAQNEGGINSTDGFASIPAHVLAICAISNLLSHESGADFLLHGRTGSDKENANGTENEEAAVHLSHLIDIALSGLSHARAEVRQMSATLAYNYTLLCTRENQLSGVWRNSGGTLDTGKADIDNGPATPKPEFELNPHAVQLLCGCLEGLLQESDVTVRRRRLAVICRILRAYGQAAVKLVTDLGFHDQFLTLYRDKGIQPPVAKEEREILAEINHVFAVTQRG